MPETMKINGDEEDYLVEQKQTIMKSTSSRSRRLQKLNKGSFVLGAMLLLMIVNFTQNQKLGQRLLSVSLGRGACQWTAPDPMTETNPLNTTTMLVSYPGSGKRLTWRILEALTGKTTGDDWDLSQNGYDSVLTMKSSYPHPEGVWLWDGYMDQVMLLVRNPRFAIPSYHTMRYELNFSTDWGASFNRKDFTYTERASIDSWESWRDARFDDEIDRWSYFIDFWMQDGLKRNTTDRPAEQDWHCFHSLMDCTPKTVIQFENLISTNRATGQAEMNKMGAVLDASANVNAIEPAARNCVYSEVMTRTELYNANRKGPPSELKSFTNDQLVEMKLKIEQLRDKYAAYPWNEQQIAVDLVTALNFYLEELEAEFGISSLE